MNRCCGTIAHLALGTAALFATLSVAYAQSEDRRNVVLMEYGAKIGPEALARSIADAAQRCWASDPQFGALRPGKVEPAPAGGSAGVLEAWRVPFVEKSAKGRDPAPVVTINTLLTSRALIVQLVQRRPDIDVQPRVSSDVGSIYRGRSPC